MSTMRAEDGVIAIFCSDLHLSARPPRVRKDEPSWFEAMQRPLNELKALSERYNAPILCAGDIFDHWRAEPELINFAINALPKMYAIPGQHDLPLHNIDLIQRSAYWTMVLVGKIIPVVHGVPFLAENKLVIHGFPWGTDLQPQTEISSKRHVAICHQYFWTDAYKYPDAPREREAGNYAQKVKGYQAVAFGDNHKGFLTTVSGVPVLNCGGFMRRKSDEEEHQPQVGLLCENGGILIHKLRTSNEKFLTVEEEQEGLRKVLRLNDMGDFLTGLTELQQKTFDFGQALEFAMQEKMVSIETRSLILAALGRK